MRRPAIRLEDERRWGDLRAEMVERQLRGRGIRAPEVLAAMGRVPRERFVDPGMLSLAYDDRALGIGGGQTISQPYIVARMTEALELPRWRVDHGDETPKVLDVGTGSGYQAAILEAMGAEVTSMERDADLAEEARQRFANLGLRIVVIVGDGSAGYPDAAPYAAIVVGAAAPAIPDPLPDQLALGGRLVAPVGRREHQWLTLVERTVEGFRREELEPCVFVPLIGRFGFAEA